MKTTRNILAVEMYVCIFVSLVIACLYETDILLPGWLAGRENAGFLVASFMELLTICLIPLALRLFKFEKIRREVSGKEKGLRVWGSVRLGMICVPMVMNTLLYYWFMNVAFGYMGIIGLICLVFVCPSEKRCLSELAGRK